MAGVFANLKPKNSVERNGFDLSRRSVFSAKCGQILPVFCQATLPDSEYQIDVRQLLRTQPLQTAAFTGFSLNYDFFFVPNNYGYSSFNEFIAQRSDQRHTGQPSYSVVPTFPFAQFLNELMCAATFDYIVSEYFHAGAFFPSDTSQFDDVPHFCIQSLNMPWASLSLECIRSLDNFGYGNYLPLVKKYASLMFTAFKNETAISEPTYADFISWLDENVPGTTASFSDLVFQIWTKLSSLLVRDSDTPNPAFAPDVKPTLWPFLAYNKAFYEFYRSIYYDDGFLVAGIGSITANNLKFDYVQLYNYDDFVDLYQHGSSFIDDESAFLRLVAMIVPKNHLYKKDLFTGVLPSTQFGDVSVMTDNRDWLKIVAKNNNGVSNWNTGTRPLVNVESPFNTAGSINVLQANANGANASVSFRFDPALAISVLEQRRADAMQRFKERMLRAGNKVKDIFKAHGWNEPYSASENQPIFLGTFDGRLDINTVAATVNADNTQLAQLGANGTGVVNGSKIHFKCHDFGYIVGVFYVVKDSEVDAYGLEKQHCLTDPFDYPYPELQNISLHPIDTLEVSTYLRWTDAPKDNPVIVGYLPRYMEYKTAMDKVHGEFHSAPVAKRDKGYGSDYPLYEPLPDGVFSDWVTPREDLNNPTSVAFLYQSPNVSDNIFLQKSTAAQSTDPFLVNCLFDVMAVEPISVIGLPI